MRTFALAIAAAVLTLGWSGIGVASAAPPKCADLGGQIDVGQICRIQVIDPEYSLTMSYPADYPDQQPVVDYVKQTRDGFLNVAKMPDSRDLPYELETTAKEFNSDVPPRGTQSVVFETYQGVGGAHPTTFYKTFNWDQGLRKPITIDNLFREGTAPFPIILPIVQSELEKSSGQPVSIAPEIGLAPATYQNFAITNDSLIFFFSQGELVAGAYGALEITVPRASVDSMIA